MSNSYGVVIILAHTMNCYSSSIFNSAKLPIRNLVDIKSIDVLYTGVLPGFSAAYSVVMQRLYNTAVILLIYTFVNCEGRVGEFARSYPR